MEWHIRRCIEHIQSFTKEDIKEISKDRELQKIFIVLKKEVDNLIKKCIKK